jgi:hypothetical protein
MTDDREDGPAKQYGGARELDQALQAPGTPSCRAASLNAACWAVLPL